MSDTSFTFRGRRMLFSGSMKAALIYVFIDVLMSGLSSLGQFLYGLKEADWRALWGPQQVGLVLIQVSTILGSAILMLKGTLSKSTREPTPQPPTLPGS